VVTYFSGIVDEDDHLRLGGYPGAFRELLGVLVEEFFPLDAGETVELSDGSRVGVWTERVRLTPGDGAEVVAEHTAAPLAGVPAITVRRVGAGAAWYVAAALDDASLARLLARVTSDAGAAAAAAVSSAGSPSEVDVTRRRGPDGSWLFVLNHGSDDVSLDISGHELVSDRTVEGVLTVDAGGCAVVREAPGD
jgi:beta-galactosidase